MTTKRKETVSRSVSFTKKLDSKIEELAERLFQDNISATIGYIVSKYFDDMENGVQNTQPTVQQNTNSPLNALQQQEQPKKLKKDVDISFLG